MEFGFISQKVNIFPGLLLRCIPVMHWALVAWQLLPCQLAALSLLQWELEGKDTGRLELQQF